MLTIELLEIIEKTSIESNTLAQQKVLDKKFIDYKNFSFLEMRELQIKVVVINLWERVFSDHAISFGEMITLSSMRNNGQALDRRSELVENLLQSILNKYEIKRKLCIFLSSLLKNENRGIVSYSLSKVNIYHFISVYRDSLIGKSAGITTKLLSMCLCIFYIYFNYYFSI